MLRTHMAEDCEHVATAAWTEQQALVLAKMQRRLSDLGTLLVHRPNIQCTTSWVCQKATLSSSPAAGRFSSYGSQNVL